MSSLAIEDVHKIKLDVFDGPLDLLLYLIKRNEVDIHDIPIDSIAEQYMEYLELMRMLDLNIAGEFIVMAATLMLIKSRMLLPPEERPEEEGDEGEDPRWDLVRQLIEYRKFKDAASFLEDREKHQEDLFGLGGEVDVDMPAELAFHDVSLFDLIAAFNAALKRAPQEDFGEVFGTSFSVADKIESLLKAVRERKSIPFSSLFEKMRIREEIVCTFLALLELIRLRHLKAVQMDRFAEITIMIADE